MDSNYLKPSFVWQGRSDSKPKERFFQIIHCCNLSDDALPQNQKVLIGFKTDTGVKRNLGRTGAIGGPEALRSSLANLTTHRTAQLFDAGDYRVVGDDLESAQDNLAQTIQKLHQQRNKLLLIGGGHEIAWPHYLGLTLAHPKQRLGIINIDAHFDLREISNHGATSGTPFWQAAQLSQNRFAYFVWGIQPQANTRTLYETAQALGVNYIEAQALHQMHLMGQHLEKLNAFIKKVDTLYLSICLDAFDISIAPGVSAPSINGLQLATVMPLLQHVFLSKKLISADIAELAPCFDTDMKTTKLAAWIAREIIEQGFTS